ncbi:MAG: D-alanyl-D-alanine carboxypeptidase, partial [Solirubrobacteraceae bacterium]
MVRIAALACLLLVLLVPAASAADRSATARALSAQMRWAGAGSGALAIDLDSGRAIYSLRVDTERMPASVDKLYTSATTLRRVGAAGRLTTTVLAATVPDADGVVADDL